MYRRYILFFFLIAFLISCGPDEDVKLNENNFPLKKGNYWIYRTTITSADEVVTVFPYVDSVWIEKDTTIDSKSYWEQVGTLRGIIYLRDSSDCVLMKELSYEQIIFSTNTDTLTKNPPVYKIITDLNELTSVPAGEFATNNCRTILRKNPLDASHDSDYPSFSKDFYTSEQYICSKKVGLVKYIYYYLGGTIEYELIRYKLN